VSRRRALIAAVLVVVLALAVVVGLLLRGSKDDRASRPTTVDEPLAYLTPGDQTVLDVDTGAPFVGLAIAQLAPRLTGGALTAAQVTPLLAGPAAASLGNDNRSQLVLVAPSPSSLDELTQGLRRTGAYRGATLFATPRGAALATRDSTLVVASTEQLVRRALDTRAAPASADARARFDKRFAGLPRDASLRVAFDPQALIAGLSKPIASTKWAKSLRDGAAVLVAGGNGLELPFHLTSDPVGLTPADLPVATGPLAPRTRGQDSITLGVRTGAQAVAFLRATGQDLFGPLDKVPGFLKPDVGGLTTDATIMSADLERFTAVTDPPDPDDWKTKLGRLEALSGFVRSFGLADLRIEDHDGVYTLTENGELKLRAAIFGQTLAISNDPTADLRAAARGRVAPPPAGARGALTLRLSERQGRNLLKSNLGLPDLLLDRVGGLTGWARVELTGATGRLDLPIR
jgi:hypothetical protein